ncbi:hypothetical protein ACEWY4_021192 [Coilia grayii]|uniref:exo-alpha-sialidase n=1 Tax=Coilia grayii TaxID=363190 RepID=A0ABD1J8A0_9TELE
MIYSFYPFVTGHTLTMGNCNCNSERTHSSETPVFADESFDFRIPALLYIKEWSKFLAFAEKRTSKKDEHAKNLVMRKGTRMADGSVEWSQTENLMKATKEGYRTMNPCPVFDRNSRTLFLFFICLKGTTLECMLKPGHTLLCYVTSTDCGDTWSDLTDLTNVIVTNFPNYRTFAVGPGHGIQLDNGTLLVPAYVKKVEGCRNCQGCWCCAGCCGCESTHSVVLRSEDQQTWQAGQPVALESGECQLAEVLDREGRSQVYMNGRSTGEKRVEALSNDGGVNFTLQPELTLKERPNGCQGSVLAFPARELPAVEAGSSESALLFSHPTAGQGWDRLELGLYLSKSLQDQPPWDQSSIIHSGRSGYSDLTHCEEEGHFACLMECGEEERLKIVFRQFELHSLKSTV